MTAPIPGGGHYTFGIHRARRSTTGNRTAAHTCSLCGARSMITTSSGKQLGPCFLCPICGGPSQRLFVQHEYWIRSCTSCQHRFAELTPAADHISRIYNDDYFQAGEAGYSDYCAEAPLLRARGQWYGHLLARYM